MRLFWQPFWSARSVEAVEVNGYEVGPNAELGEANLVGADLSGVDLTFSDLTNARLDGANLTGANLGGADLTSASLDRANLDGANLSGACLTGVKLNDEAISLREVRFCMADLRGVEFVSKYPMGLAWRAVLNRVDFTEANLENVDFSRCALMGLRLRRANLRGASFERARLGLYHVAEADFREANFCGAQWGGYVNEGSNYFPVEIEDAYLTDAIADAATGWPGGFDPKAAGVVFK